VLSGLLDSGSPSTKPFPEVDQIPDKKGTEENTER
jgi:hypothetical protein